ncbi:hypothetical protein [Paeniglutamicibacter sp.]|uniref:hypothetical protein n=1 Tax=Paeniglutamicibacter sp. TaxID=1934391 RepID=UPI003989092F
MGHDRNASRNLDGTAIDLHARITHSTAGPQDSGKNGRFFGPIDTGLPTTITATLCR